VCLREGFDFWAKEVHELIIPEGPATHRDIAASQPQLVRGTHFVTTILHHPKKNKKGGPAGVPELPPIEQRCDERCDSQFYRRKPGPE
jgi:hypothetical protein